MPVSDWHKHRAARLGIVVTVALAFGVGLSYYEHRQSKCADCPAKEQRQETPDKTERALVGIVIDAPPVRNPNPERSEWREEQDLEAQKDMARWALFLLIVSTIGVLITFAGIIYVKRTLSLTRRSVEATERAIVNDRHAAEAQLRPYVYASKAAFEWGSAGGAYAVVTVKNGGVTPATFFDVAGKMFLRMKGESTPPTPHEFDRFSSWSALGPSDELRVHVSGLSDLRRIAQEVNAAEWGDKSLYFIGVVRYGDSFGSEYQTEFAFFSLNAVPDKEIEMSRPTGRLRTFVKLPKASEQQT